MENKEHISKVFVILESIAHSKAKYIEVLNTEDEVIFKIKLIVDSEDMVDLLDGFFDNGFKVRQITKEDFDGFESSEILKFNL
jgi:hypothetical protein